MMPCDFRVEFGRKIPAFYIYADSPLALIVTEVAPHRGYLVNGGEPFGFQTPQVLRSVEESKA